MGGSSIYDGGADPGNVDAVQGIRVAGAEQVLYCLALFLHSCADLLHHGGFPGAGPTLQDQQVIVPLGGAEWGKQALEAPAAVGAQKKMRGIRHGFSSRSYKFSFHNMRKEAFLTKKRPCQLRQWRGSWRSFGSSRTAGAPDRERPPSCFVCRFSSGSYQRTSSRA